MTRERLGWAFLVLVFVGALAARRWGYGLVRVETASMAPALPPGAVAFYSKRAAPKAGDVAVIELADEPGVLHVKRLVAGGGQEVELHRGLLYVDGQRVTGELGERAAWIDPDCAERAAPTAEEPAGGLAHPPSRAVLPGGEHEREVVPDGRWWALGDNRGNSSDSRHWGGVDPSEVVGIARYVIWYRPPCGRPGLDRIGSIR